MNERMMTKISQEDGFNNNNDADDTGATAATADDDDDDDRLLVPVDWRRASYSTNDQNIHADTVASQQMDDAMMIAAGYKYDHPIESSLDVHEDECADDDEEQDQDYYCPYNLATTETETSVPSTKLSPSMNHDFWKNWTYTSVLIARTQERKQIPLVYLLGSIFHPIHDYQRRKQYQESLFWFTYRYDFTQIKPYHITTDAGWGCMLRSAQMLLAHALRVHFSQSHRHWCTVTNNSNNKNSSNQYNNNTQQLLTWFLDMPSTNRCFYSLHNMCAAGLAKYQVLPGEWYGPGTACYVLRDLVTMHQEQQPATPLFRVHVATEGTVYRQTIEDLMTRDGMAKLSLRQREQHGPSPPAVENDNSTTLFPLSHPLFDPLLSPVIATTESTNNKSTCPPVPTGISLEWDTSLLLMVPLRLGLDHFHPDYVQSLARTFALPQSVGVLGGRPRGARWFFGAYADGSKILGLDPHTVQPALSMSQLQHVLNKDGNNSTKNLPIEYLESVHTPYPETIDLIRMDPSIALGFYCRTGKDLKELEQSLRHIVSDGSDDVLSLPELVTFMEYAPNYEDGGILSESDVLKNDDDDNEAIMMGDVVVSSQRTKTIHNAQLDNNNYDDDDEDDYVLL
jgi:cysteine protease ATG4